MNLVIRVTLLFASVSLIVFLIGGVISFRVMMREINDEQRHFLNERMDRVTRMIERRKPKDTLRMNKLVVIPLEKFVDEQKSFRDTLVIHAQLERLEPHLKLDAIKNVEGRSYQVVMYDVIVEPDDIRDGLEESLVKIYLILIGAVVIVGFIISTYMLRPFNQTLQAIKKFSIKDQEAKPSFPKTGVAEFKRLNLFLEEMTEKVKSDYQSLKEFSENASHELQTPIAIIQGKLEVLMDANKLDEEQINQIGSAQHTLNRLKNLSTSLSILTRIENKEFDKVSALDFSAEVEKMLNEFKELIELKSITLTTEIEAGVSVEMDGVLCELLLTNLINNAIRHNLEKGSIHVSLTKETLEVVNSGPDLDVDPSELFQRFKKSNQSSSSLGLGLAIVKKICDLYSCRLEYSQSNQQHRMKVGLNP